MTEQVSEVVSTSLYKLECLKEVRCIYSSTSFQPTRPLTEICVFVITLLSLQANKSVYYFSASVT